jgi:lactoylglutathione lyase
MPGTSFNHVSLGAPDLDASLAFYTGLLGLERIPSLTFRRPTAWLRVGDRELHLVQEDTPPPLRQHVALNVDNFEAVYAAAVIRGCLDRETWGSYIYELPDGAVQLYLRDPAGNLVEIDWPDARSLDRSIVTELPKLADAVPQHDSAAGATLYLGNGASSEPPIDTRDRVIRAPRRDDPRRA